LKEILGSAFSDIVEKFISLFRPPTIIIAVHIMGKEEDFIPLTKSVRRKMRRIREKEGTRIK
jgi:hypothetical protein